MALIVAKAMDLDMRKAAYRTKNNKVNWVINA
jgi:hypothetical protein